MKKIYGGVVMEEFQNVTIYYVNDLLFFVPYVYPVGGFPTDDFPHAVTIPYCDDDQKKVSAMFVTLSMSRKSIPPIDWNEYWRQAEGIFKNFGIRNRQNFFHQSLNFSVYREGLMLAFTPGK
jgi:hypothetical protein